MDLKSLEITREKLYEQIAKQIQEMIVQGGVIPGEKLPPERELAKDLGVSRTVVREAIKALQERGLVRVLTGSGTYVTKVPPDVVAQSMALYVAAHKHAFHDLMQIRQLLEVEIAGLAAERATEEDIQRLESALTEMHEALPQAGDKEGSLEQFTQADILFHQSLARASKNSLYPILLIPILDLLFEFIQRASRRSEGPVSAIAFHQAILDCVRNGDPIGCREAMREHLRSAAEYFELGQASSRVSE